MMKQKYALLQARQFILLVFALSFSTACTGRPSVTLPVAADTIVPPIITGAERDSIYLPKLQNKKVAVVANQTSITRGVHLVDHLLKNGINVRKVFAPEHGFRGEAGPGDKVDSGKDPVTGIPVVSLYGNSRKPSAEAMQGIDVIVFDIQDVGARFYTYISTLQYLVEACAAHNVSLMVLDRPNPNGFYIDGPVLDTAYRSFVGIAPIPVVHGLTVGEYAKMSVGEEWSPGTSKCSLEVIPMENYNHTRLYEIPVPPSPNLRSMNAIYLYPSLCFFEGAKVSVGRGTDKPFQIIGFPGYNNGTIEFTPKEIPGVIRDPPYEDELCKGIYVGNEAKNIIVSRRLNLGWIIEMYNAYPDKNNFFIKFFDTLAGTSSLRKSIIEGKSEEQIRESWQPDLDEYKKMRGKYLLYGD